jgi:hypothetical protein
VCGGGRKKILIFISISTERAYSLIFIKSESCSSILGSEMKEKCGGGHLIFEILLSEIFFSIY